MKLLFAGGALKLPIKGSQIFKKDNPIILCGSNYSLRDHVKRKYSTVCHCPIPNNRTLNSKHSPLCHKSATCNTTDSASLYYDALCSRIKEYNLPGPLFPNGGLYPELWEKLKSLLNQAAITTDFTAAPLSNTEWEQRLDKLIQNAYTKEVPNKASSKTKGSFPGVLQEQDSSFIPA